MRKRWINMTAISASLVGIAVGLLFGFLVLLVSRPQFALQGFATLLVGALSGGGQQIGAVLFYATFYILCGLGVGFAGKCGSFNIGVTGQFMVGSFAACYIGVTYGNLPHMVLFPLAVLGAAAAGALWGMLIGMLKAFFNISEVVVGILMNYVALYLVNMLLLGSIYDPLGNSSLPVSPNAVTPNLGLNRLFPNSAVDLGIVVAVLAAICIYIILEKTTYGYEIKICGYNPEAGQYAGINSKRNIISSMAIAGALAGLAGAFLHLSASGTYLQVIDVLPSYPMSGMSASLLAMSNPIGIIFTGLLISYITVSGFSLQAYGYVTEIVDIVTAAIIYCSAFVMVTRMFLEKTGKRLFARRDRGADR